MGKSKKTAQKQPDEAAPSFEKSLAELQNIVNELEEGTIGLEESMQRFEKGISLLRTCYQILEKAEQKIEVLTGMDDEGNPVTAPFKAPATVETSQPADARKESQARGPSGDPKATDDNSATDDSESRLF